MQGWATVEISWFFPITIDKSYNVDKSYDVDPIRILFSYYELTWVQLNNMC